MFDAEAPHAPLRIFDSVRALAFIGDLSMGQPTDHSLRTAWLAVRLAEATGFDAAICDTVREVALLRWSGCTANAAGFAQLFGDDVAIRSSMLESRAGMAEALGRAGAAMLPLARIHCEVSGEVARILGLSNATETALRHIFEAWDGNGLPAGLVHEQVPAPVSIVAVAGDLEVFSRAYGVDRALELIGQRAGARYPAPVAGMAACQAGGWLAELARISIDAFETELITADMQRATSAEVIADIVDLKLPWMTGFSRSVAATAAMCHARLSSDDAARELVYRAGLIHGMGRAAVANGVWNLPTPLPAGAWEKVRLVPYWTERAGRQTGALREAAMLASHAYERQDGSGYFRGVRAPALALEARVLAASVAWVALRSARPWRAALSDAAAANVLKEEVARGRLCGEAVSALLSEKAPAIPRGARRAQHDGPRLSAREIDVLRAISRGASNKAVAQALNVSPSTVRTHVENAFRKLECSTRAAATLKASMMGLL
ncbi:LuxR family transcriptional regulator [Burkholderia sp. AU19243]|uniref:HD domain-containing phosphohydrolase n=1 Tax=Burkholderia TaxID=32008 RepID=UPI00084142F2|nr:MULTISPECIES: HD domain-containing phosphohydrolase [Burkholderia]AOK06219.1 LuxR family transcriptional regulator [Burkholderia latens]MBR8144625.1 LuxR family transcriptional regulator [Burkholderia vietnamiensis]MBR8363480.1 LuxR family transcriptional regulator [Burkholderia sp. AU19243]MCA8308166.1 LuxR C-terminal-related transcriptional regulator [Burkholderia sp. AU28942]